MTGVQTCALPISRASYEGSAGFHRTWGWIGIVSGALVAGGGGAWLAINAGPKSDKQKVMDTLTAELAAEEADPKGHVGGVCDFSGTNSSAEKCNAAITAAQADYDDVKKKDVVGYIGLGVGGAVLVTGVILLVTGDDPHRYEHAPTHKLGQARTPRVAWAPGPGQVGGGLQFAF